MDEYIVQRESLTAIADAIRKKTNTTSLLFLEEMPAKIEGIKNNVDSIYAQSIAVEPGWIMQDMPEIIYELEEAE